MARFIAALAGLKSAEKDSGKGLIQVGFWKDTKALFDLSGNPDPRELSNPAWYEGWAEPIAQYLDSGKVVESWLGCSYCRFGCKNVDMGSRDLSDGAYLWPEGLSHYVRAHGVVLPREFIRHVIRRIGRGQK